MLLGCCCVYKCGMMSFVSNLKQYLTENNGTKIQHIQSKCYETLSSTLKNYDGERNKVREDKFAQCILTDEIKAKIITSEDQKVIAGM